MQIRRAAKAVARFAVDYLDLLIAAGLAIYFAVSGITGGVKDDDLVAAAIALLGVLALATFRERWERAKAVGEIQHAVSIASASKPWSVLDATYSWDLQSDDGRRAHSRVRKEVRIEQDEVMTLYEFSARAVGTVTSHRCWGRRAGAAADFAMPIIHDSVKGRQGRRYRLISLESTFNRGDRLTCWSERELKDFFTDDTEDVSINVEVPTDAMTLVVVWPATRKPRTLTLERSDRRPDWLDVDRLETLADGRVKLVERVNDPRLGERVMLSWTW